MAYRIPKDDGTFLKGVTVRDGIVYDKDGKRLGPESMFPRMEKNTGSFFDGAKGGKYDTEAETETPETTETPEVRVSPTGIQQTGKKLGLGDINGLFASLNERGQMKAGELPSAGGFFSAALVTTPQSAYQGGELKISTKDTGYEVGAPVNKGTKIDSSQVSYQDAPGYEVPETSVPMTTGRDGDDVQEGVSDKPDVADQIRQVRMHRNKRDQLEGFSMDTPFGGESETKGDGMTASRRAARSAFLDEGNKGYAAIRARDRAVGSFHQYDQGGMKIGDDIHMFNEGMSKDARFALSGDGIKSKDDAQDFLNTYVQGFNKPENPAEENK
jgi:hypothetical protein